MQVVAAMYDLNIWDNPYGPSGNCFIKTFRELDSKRKGRGEDEKSIINSYDCLIGDSKCYGDAGTGLHNNGEGRHDAWYCKGFVVGWRKILCNKDVCYKETLLV